MDRKLEQELKPVKRIHYTFIFFIFILNFLHFYNIKDNISGIYKLNSYLYADPELLCTYIRCDIAKINDNYYKYNKNTYQLELINNYKEPDDIISKMKQNKYIINNYTTLYKYDNNKLYDYLFYIIIPLLIIIFTYVQIIVIKKTKKIGKSFGHYLEDKYKLEVDIKTSLAASAHHEMLTPIAVMKTLIDNLEVNCKENSNRMQPIFKKFKITINRLESVLNQMSSYRKSIELDVMTIYDILSITLDSLKIIYTEFNFEYTIKDKSLFKKYVPYILDSGALSNIFNNLFKNSLEAGSSRIIITGKLITKSKLEIYVIDNGDGIPEHIVKNNNLFKLGKTTKPNTKKDEPLHGTGLYLVKEILNSVNGDIELYKTSKDGTIFKITILVEEYHEQRS